MLKLLSYLCHEWGLTSGDLFFISSTVLTGTRIAQQFDFCCMYFLALSSLNSFCLLHSEVLDREEFGEATRNLEYDENTINSALDLGLLVSYQMIKKTLSSSVLIYLDYIA